MLNAKKLSLIHVAKNQLHLADDEYRALLDSVCGVSSAKEIRTDADFKALIKAFEKLGFQQQAAVSRTPDHQGSTEKQFHLMVALWKQYTHEPEAYQENFNAFVKRRFGLTDYRQLNRFQASKMIETLKEMVMRKTLAEVSEYLLGHNPDLVENQLFELYQRLVQDISPQNLAAILAVLCYQDANLQKGFNVANQMINDKALPQKHNKESQDEKIE